ncbi:DUF7261 family protein [Halorubrum laminariae]|uniref:Type IV pilin n=1 Tax=Halorubrum laminariae TaxID=1433523 RepID=A0ABD6C2X8_9EURY|nr:hypothetical protein [Halorubrum laminariae]
MADVTAPAAGDDPNRGRLRDDDRGQLLLVAGLVMAVSLVALVVLLNASIYSENLATRGVEAADGEPLEIRAAAVDGTGTLIDATNRGQPGSYSAAETDIENGIVDLDRRLGRTAARRGGIANLSLTDDELREGRYVTGSLDDSSNVSAVEQTRSFTVAADTSSTDEDNPFTVVFNRTGSNTTHEAYAYESSSGTVVVETGTNGTNVTEACRIDGIEDSRVTVDVTGESVDGESCPGIWPTELSEESDAYVIEFANTADVDAEMAATVLSDGSVSSLETTPAVYDATLRFRYRTADLRFETTVRVAPGEPND